MKTILSILVILFCALGVKAQQPVPIDTTNYALLKNMYSRHTIDSLLLLKASSTRTYSVSSRSLNTAFQPSTTHDCIVFYYVQITSTLSLSGGQSGTVTLQLSPTNSVYTITGTDTNNNTGALTLGLSTSQVQTAALCTFVPAGIT